MAQDGYRELPLTFKVVFKASDCQVDSGYAARHVRCQCPLFQVQVRFRFPPARRDLVEHHGLPPGLARDLRDALHLLIGLRLDHHLRQRRLGQPADNLVEFRDLGTLEHAQLDSAVGIVKDFRKYLQLHCPFEML